MVCRDLRLIFHNGCSYQQVHPEARPQGVQECTIPASNAFWGQKAGCWDNPKPLKVSGVLLANFAFAVSQRRCLLVHSRQLATCKHFATQNQ